MSFPRHFKTREHNCPAMSYTLTFRNTWTRTLVCRIKLSKHSAYQPAPSAPRPVSNVRLRFECRAQSSLLNR
ncbi:hypothetical protein VTI28DRAFT_9673 [Corynascus sepedonium]